MLKLFYTGHLWSLHTICQHLFYFFPSLLNRFVIQVMNLVKSGSVLPPRLPLCAFYSHLFSSVSLTGDGFGYVGREQGKSWAHLQVYLIWEFDKFTWNRFCLVLVQTSHSQNTQNIDHCLSNATLKPHVQKMHLNVEETMLNYICIVAKSHKPQEWNAEGQTADSWLGSSVGTL